MAFQPCPVVTQPMAASRCYPSSFRGWKSGLLDCNADKTICACGACVPCILACKVAVDYGECCCVPFLPGALIAMRTGLREQLRIQGCVCCDWVAFCCCCPCALCQMARELKSPC
ncbi:cornifelin-like [Sceloporus undulatus]|uniref:cornifelin-like n=1 Tax=Sceloporus undulatus TaxID=8520 RepID=UPI001C4BEDEA|nr:cornifelin-like [Sceloporus undulatus]